MIVHIAENESVVTAYGEYKGTGAWLRYVLHVREVLLPVELFYGVAVVPVPGDDKPSAILFYACGKAALTVQTAEAPETVGGGAVHLYRKELPYAQGLLMATAYHYLSRAKRQAEALVVRVDGRHEVPLAVAKVFGGGSGYEAMSMAAYHRRFTVCHKHHVTSTRNIQIGLSHDL